MFKIKGVEQEKQLEKKYKNCKWMTYDNASYDNWFEYDIMANRGKSLLMKCQGPSKYYGKSLFGNEAENCRTFEFK